VLEEQAEVVLLVEHLLPFFAGVVQADVEAVQDAFEAAEGQPLQQLVLWRQAVVVQFHPGVRHEEELFLAVQQGLLGEWGGQGVDEEEMVEEVQLAQQVLGAKGELEEGQGGGA
jgi:hypothetical protein